MSQQSTSSGGAPTLRQSNIRAICSSLRGKLVAGFYAGNRFHCPICNGHFRHFLDFGAAGAPVRRNARCPGCQSLERHRLLWLYLQQRTNLFSAPHKILHFAPEYIFQRLFASQPNLEYIAADLNATGTIVKMDVTQIPCPDDSFDAVLCNHVLEHVPDDQLAMREIRRVLKPGGWAILQVPIEPGLEQTFEDATVTSPSERLRLFGQQDHVRLYGSDYTKRLESAGFAVRTESFTAELGPRLTASYGLMSGEDIFLCLK